MDADIQKKLREKFDTAHIGLKPKITCPACSKAFGKECDKHPKSKCTSLRGGPGCGQWITPQHMHIEFVGHADVTDRLLEVDPDWTWEPVAFGPDGLPALTPDGGLWIRLTVAGVTRIGYGGADGKTGDDAVKEAVSDALKVTAMRFGVALDLWRKNETSGKPAEDEVPQQRTNGHRQDQPPPPGAAEAARVELRALVKAAGADGKALADRFQQQYGEELATCTDATRITAFAKLQNLSSSSRVETANGTAR